MGLAATHMLAYFAMGRFQFVPNNNIPTTNEPLTDELHKKSDVNWLTHQVLDIVIKT